MTIVHVGIDLAKNVFAVHAVDEHGKPALVRPAVPRARLHEVIAALPPCVVAMEACSGAHHWARLFATHGHTVRLIAPKFVAPWRRSCWATPRRRGRRPERRARRGRSPQRTRQAGSLCNAPPTTRTSTSNRSALALVALGNAHYSPRAAASSVRNQKLLKL